MDATVVFTGPAVLSNGTRILRASLIKASNAAGFKVAPTYDRHCNFVVASRADTIKATRAAADGKLVLTYDEFVKHLGELGVNATHESYGVGSDEHPVVDTYPTKEIVAWQEKTETGAFVL